jgi:predicted dehydrogenase
MTRLTRRQLLKTTLAAGAAAGLALPAYKAFGRVLGANDVIRVAVIGLHGRGKSHIATISRVAGMRLAALCDVDPAVLDAAAKAARKCGQNAETFNDPRKLLDRKDIDAVTIATPNHWHALLGIWACQAGKDVYVEKPVSHNVWEGRQLVNAARRHQRMVQSGTQARANPDVIAAVSWLRAGNLGKLRYARGFCYKPRLSIGKVGHGDIPPGLDYDLWCGPAPRQPLRRQNLHYDWHWFYDYGNGDLGNTGIHETDQARWLLGHETISPRVMSVGGRWVVDDDGETPNTQLICHDYDGPPILFEVRGLPRSVQYQSADAWRRNMDRPEGFPDPHGIGVIVVGEGGRLILEDGGIAILAVDAKGKVIQSFQARDEHGIGWPKGDYHNFLSWRQAIRSRRTADLVADILQGHISSAMCHTAMISHRLGQARPSREIHEAIQGNPLAADRFEAMLEHLASNGVDLQRSRLTCGPWLRVDPASERFVDHDAANALLRAPCREPFVVPENV